MVPQSVSLFTGCAALDLAVENVFGSELLAYSEIEPAACRVLEARRPGVPNLGDVAAIDWSTLERDERRRLIVTAGFPCTDVSLAGARKGLRPGTRSGLWSHMAYAVAELRPDLAVIENVRGLTSADAHCELELCPWCVGIGGGHYLRALGAVLGDLADLRYDAQWVGLRAADAGAPHPRFRLFVLAWPAADPARNGWHEGWPESVGDAGRAEPARGGLLSPADPARVGRERVGESRRGRGGPADDDRTLPDTAGAGWEGLRPEPARRGPERGGAPAPDAGSNGCEGRAERDVGSEAGQPPSLGGDIARRVLDWGVYGPAIRRWERVLGRAAPEPTVTGPKGGQQLSARFVEWMQGLPAGYVTDVPGVSRNAALRVLGNCVVPQQAEMALRILLEERARYTAAA